MVHRCRGPFQWLVSYTALSEVTWYGRFLWWRAAFLEAAEKATQKQRTGQESHSLL